MQKKYWESAGTQSAIRSRTQTYSIGLHMHNSFSTPSLNLSAPSKTADTALGVMDKSAAESSTAGTFSEVLDTQTSMAEKLEELRELLPADEFQQLESMLEEGNPLAAAEIIAALRQQLAALKLETPSGGALPGSNITTNTLISGQTALPLGSDAQALNFADQTEVIQALDTAAVQLQKPSINALFQTIEAGVLPVNGVSTNPILNQQNLSSTVPLTQTNPLPVDVHPGEKGWNNAIGERILWMVGRQLQSAEIQITPPQLGPINIRISIQNDQANVSFVAQHGAVRDALEVAIPRLREMLGENNLQLVNVDVNQRGTDEQRMASEFFNRSSSGENSDNDHELDDEMEDGTSIQAFQSNGLVDDFA